MDWREMSRCRTEDPDLFFPIGEGVHAAAQTAAAIAVCQRCAVLEPCLNFALATGAVGVWGGLDDDGRRNLRRASRWPAA
jgi:WhiB family transcriptional regulator, redox-sensing transcriptional regulator